MPCMKNLTDRRQTLAAIVACALAPAAWTVRAQTAFPLAKPARLLVGFPPGGSADLMARALLPHLGSYASSIIVDNKPGAGGRIALDAGKLAEADGTTVVVTPSSMLTIYPHIYRKLNYDPLKDFLPVANIASFPFVLVVGPAVPAGVKTLKEFLNWCQANPAKAAYASPGNGSTPHFAGAALARASRVELTHVPYKGGAPAMNDVVGGQIAANIAVISNALPMIQSGKVRALAVTGNVRSSALPDVPTMQEAGFRGVQVIESFYVLLPSRVAPETARRLHQAVADAMQSRGMQDLLAKASFDPAPPALMGDLARSYRQDIDRWGAIVKAAGFTPED